MNRKIKMTASVLNAIVEYYGKLLTVRPDVEVIGIYNKFGFHVFNTIDEDGHKVFCMNRNY